MNSVKSVLYVLGLSYLSTGSAQNKGIGIFKDEQCGILHNFQNGEIKFPWSATIYTVNGTKTHIPTAILSPSLVVANVNYYFKESGRLALHDFSKYLVSANLKRLNQTSEDNPFVQTVEITHIRLHPKVEINCHWSFFNNDYAFIHLKTPLVFDNQVHAMCLPTPEILENILNPSSSDTAEEKTSILVSGWSHSTPDYSYHNLTLNTEDTCEDWWKYNLHDETKGAPYINRFCANVSSGYTHVNCIHRDNAVVGRVDTVSYYFLGIVNNFYSDNGICNDKTRIFVSRVTDFDLDFIHNSTRCGPNNFTCDSGQCVPVEGICNEVDDCDDGSDENDLYCDAFPATAKEGKSSAFSIKKTKNLFGPFCFLGLLGLLSF